jgi:RNA polymerase sigma-70 factor, ECF subfamily
MAPALRPPLMLVPPAVTTSERVERALDDSALIAGLKARDASLSHAFYERVRPIVDRTLFRLLGARDNDYEDVAQRALFELVDTIERFRGECPLDAWISIVTARAAFRAIRRRRVERRIFVPIEVAEPVGLVRSHGGAIAARQAVERVCSCLEKMDQNRAWTYLLHDVYGYDLKEVAQITGASLSAAQSRLVRGRRDLHERIGRDPALSRFLHSTEAE